MTSVLVAADRPPAPPVPTAPRSRLRVMIVTESFLPVMKGVARSVAMVLAHLGSRGHEVLVVTPGDGPDRHGPVPVVRLPSVSLPFNRGFPLGVPTPTLRAAIRAFRPDVVHLASPVVVGARAAVVARELGIPSVAIYQTDLAGFAGQYGMGRAATPLWHDLRWVHSHVDRTLAPSRAAARDLRDHGIRQVERWARGVDGVAFAPTHRTRPPTEQVRTVRVGYVGRLSAEKRVDRLQVLSRLPGTELVVVGDGPELDRLRRRLPDARFTGALSGGALSRAFADLDVFVHTGTHETFCQSAQEALASGVPVVAPAAGGLLDTVRHGTNGLLWRPDRVDELRHAVTRLASSSDERARLGAAARVGTLGRTWAVIGDELIGHYHAVGARDRRIAA